MAQATVALGLLAVSLAPGCGRTARLSAEEIVARNAAARGGRDGWRKVETMVWKGHIESAHARVPSMPFQLEQKRPNKTRLEVYALGEMSVRAFDGVHGWALHPARGRPALEPFTLGELKFAQGGHGVDGPLQDHAARGNAVALEGVDEIGGRRAYHLTLRLAQGGSEDVWVDTETYLEARHDRMADGKGGAPRRVSVTYGDYRAFEGLKIPFLITTLGGPGETPDRMQIETVALNTPLDDSRFEPPAAARPRDRVRPGYFPRARAPTAPSTVPTASSGGGGSSPQ
ncbi:MAG TPA: hypothetical protein VFG53_10725 [Anaeromyxobacter sp.]|nr:hypothetical protein [Anaeromyxobacter sp.]